jgi:hypothetical protein
MPLTVPLFIFGTAVTAISQMKSSREHMAKDVGEMVRFNLMVTPAWLAAVDAWRIQQPGIPNRSEAVRRMVEQVTATKVGKGHE